MLEAGHPDDQVLEQYSMEKLEGAALEALEEHVLLCGNCQDRVLEFDSFVRGMRFALAQPVPEPAPRWSFFDWLRMPVPVWTAAAVAGIGLVGIFATSRMASVNTAPLAIALSATRGTTSPVATTPGGLDLDLDARDLGPGSYRVQVVNADGAEMWSADATAKNGHVRALVAKRLAAGQYYVRIANPAGGKREFSLRLGN